MDNKAYELIIVGGGAAGLTAAIYAVRSGLDFLLLDTQSSMGSQLAQTDEIDNYTGFDSVNGMELITKFYAHAKSVDAPMLNDEILTISKENDLFILKSAENTYRAKTVVYCAGASHRKLGVKGEQELLGSGVGYCAVCDGFFYRGKTAAIVGGGNTAATEALFLSKICSRVILIHRRDRLRADKALVKKLEQAENIDLKLESEVEEICGAQRLEGVLLKSGERIDCDGVFIAVGIVPASKPAIGLGVCNDGGYIEADESGKTDCEGFFAAGDVRTKALRQIITACADGANCIESANKFLNGEA